MPSRWEAIIEGASDAIIAHSPDGTILYASAAIEELSGHKPEELVGKTFLGLIEPKAQQDLLAEFAKLVGGQQARRLTFKLVRKDGSTCWAQSTGKVQRDENGAVTAVVSVTRDVTEQHDAEVFIAAEGRLLERFANGAPREELLAGICAALEEQLADCRFSIALAIDSGRAATVAAAPTLPADYARKGKRLHAGALELSLGALGAAAGLGHTSTVEIAAADGARLGWLACHSIEPHGNPSHRALVERMCHLARIVIERSRDMAALRTSEENYRTVVEALREVVFRADAMGNWALLNHAWSRLTGRAPEESLGRKMSEDVAPADRGEVAIRVRELMSGSRTQWNGEIRLLGVDGRLRTVEVVARPVLDPGRSCVGIAGLLSDTTERKQLEAQLLLSNRLACIGALASGVAHDLEGPLGSIVTTAEGAAAELPKLAGEGQAAVEAALTSIRASAATLKAGFEEISRVSASDDEMAPMDPQIPLEATLRSVEHLLRGRAAIDLERGTLPHVVASHGRLAQLFLNLVTHAIERQGDEVGVDRRVHVRSCTSPEGQACVEVSDGGRGLTPEAIKSVFEPLLSSKGSDAGTELRLLVAHRIAAQLGGTLEIDSRPLQRTTVRVLLPAAAASSRRSIVRGGTGRPKLRLLCVDDDATVLKALRWLLAKDHEVVSVQSGADALALFEQGARFDVVVCDLLMPQLTGMDLYRRVHESWPDVARRMIFLTGAATTPMARAFLAEVKRPCVEKPVEGEVIRAVIAQCAVAASEPS